MNGACKQLGEGGSGGRRGHSNVVTYASLLPLLVVFLISASGFAASTKQDVVIHEG
jgi:hypothetical protein